MNNSILTKTKVVINPEYSKFSLMNLQGPLGFHNSTNL